MGDTRAAVRPSRAARPRARRAAPERAEQAGRERILAVAIRSFSTVGYEGTTTAGVAREAGVTQPLVHHHFGSKEGLWQAAMEELFRDVRALTAPSDGTPAERLLRPIEQFVRFVAARPEVTRVVAREGAAPSPRLTHLVTRYLREPFRDVVAAVREGQRAGLIDTDVRPELVLFMILGAGSHLFDVTALARESVGVDATAAATREDFMRLLRDLLRGGILREPAPTRPTPGGSRRR
jgi:TetR/AcrR family transcriptional regulator